MTSPTSFTLVRDGEAFSFGDFASLATLTFDDLPLGGASEAPLSVLAPLLGGFSWTQAGIAQPAAYPGLGYATASGDQIAFVGEKSGAEIEGYDGEPGSGLVIAREERFDLVSLVLSAAFDEGLPVTITGTRWDGSTITLAVAAPRVDAPGDVPLRVTFGEAWTDLRSVSIDGPGYFGIDDLETRTADVEAAFARSLTVLDFDDIDLGGASEGALALLAPGYGGFAWTQAGIALPAAYPGLGYASSSGDQIAFVGEKNGAEIAGYEGASGSGLILARDEAFDLHGITVTAAFQEALPVTFLGTRADGGTVSLTIAAPRIDAPGEAPLAVAFGSDWRDLVSLAIDGPDYFGIDDLAFSTGDRLVLGAAVEASVTRTLQGGDTLVTWEGGSALLLGYAAVTPGDIVFA